MQTFAWASSTLTFSAPAVPKNRRPKFELHLRIIELNNVPLVSGTSFIKWHLPASTAAEHRGRTSKCMIKDHKVSYEYSHTIPVRLVVDKNSQMLQETWIDFEILQEYSSGGRGERIELGSVRMNLSEYVDASEHGVRGGSGETKEEDGIVRRYLMQDSKINSTLKIGIYMKQIEGDRNFIAPPLRTAPVFGGIAGIMTAEVPESSDDLGHIPSLSSKSRETGELQDMYRRTLAAYWAAQPGELKADECIEDIFAGGDGWGSPDINFDAGRAKPAQAHHAVGDDSGSYSSSPRSTHPSASTPASKKHHTAKSISRLDHVRAENRDSGNNFGDNNKGSGTRGFAGYSSGRHRRNASETRVGLGDGGVKGRGSLEQQARKVEMEERHGSKMRPMNEVDELDAREDLRSWRIGVS
ncbi:hypothetical protein LTR66_011208 [Elasticomyces elasticus]|nr:hypothetical protein LTR66_011208 [Elasticomyces elasticus]